MFFNLFPPSRDSMNFEWKLKAIKMGKSDNNNYGGKVILPEFILEILTFSEIELPWTFKISNNNGDFSTYVGVLDFTAPFGQIMLPNWLFEQLNIINGYNIKLRYKQIPKGQLCQLLPLKKDWLEVENAKKILEDCLVNYPIISEGDTIDLNFNDHGIMQFTVLQVDNPNGSIYIVDTDLSVDLKPPLDINNKSSKRFKIIKIKDKDTGFEIIRPKKFGFFTVNFKKK